MRPRNVTIIHSDDCPRCESMITWYRSIGIEPELYHDLSEIRDPERRRNLMAELMVNDGDKGLLPLVFEDDEYME